MTEIGELVANSLRLDKQLAFLIKDKTTLLSMFGMNIRYAKFEIKVPS